MFLVSQYRFCQVAPVGLLSSDWNSPKSLTDFPGAGPGFASPLPLASVTEPPVQPFCWKTLAVSDLMTLSSGSVNCVRLDVVSWVPCPALLVGRRASIPRVLETTTFLPTVV